MKIKNRTTRNIRSIDNKPMENNQIWDKLLTVIISLKKDIDRIEKIDNFFQDETCEKVPEIIIPKKYKQLVHKIVNSINARHVCFVNTDTFEVEDIPQKLLNNPSLFDETSDLYVDYSDMKYKKWKEYIKIEPIEPHFLFQVMELFVEKMQDSAVKKKLKNVLDNENPFAKFKQIVNNSDFQQDWVDFQLANLRRYVYYLLKDYIDL